MMMLHTMLRVGDLNRSIDFYTKVLGMNLLRTTERPTQKYSLAFVAYGKGNADGQSEIELTYNHGVSSYDLGTAYGILLLVYQMLTLLAKRLKMRVVTSPVRLAPLLVAIRSSPLSLIPMVTR